MRFAKPYSILFVFICLTLTLFTGAEGADYIADYRVSKENVLRQIPLQYINAAKSNLHIMYCGTSHSSQTADGMRGMMQYKAGDDTLFAVTFNGTPTGGALDIHYRPSGPYSASDLSHDSTDAQGHTDYFYRTVEYLDSPAYSDVNVVMWSWCSIEGHDVQTYLDNFQELINMYRAGGSKGRTAANAVNFVFMTGYARGSDGDTPEPPYIHSPYQNHKRIVDYCRANGYFCLDYWSQDTYEYETDAYKPSESGNNNAQHLAYVNSHVLGTDWFQGRSYSSGSVRLPAHANQHLTGNRRAYAAWWIWARLAGWDGNTADTGQYPDFNEDNHVDLVWRNNLTGLNRVWCMNGVAQDGGALSLPTIADTNWCIKGTGDFNADGHTDILWRYCGNDPNGGKNVVWFMNGSTRTGSAFLPRVRNLDWDIEGTGDFNNDGSADILWRYYGNGRTGLNVVWYMTGSTRDSIVMLPRVADLDWRCVGTGDFNDDGHADILWRNAGSGVNRGKNIVWTMNGANRTAIQELARVQNLNWDVRGTGDFNDDGNTDIIWRCSGSDINSGKNVVWFMNGLSRNSIGDIQALGDLNWDIVN